MNNFSIHSSFSFECIFLGEKCHKTQILEHIETLIDQFFSNYFWVTFIGNNFNIKYCSRFSIERKNFFIRLIERIWTPKTSASFSLDHVNGIFDTCNRNVPSSSSSSNIFNEEDGVLSKTIKRENKSIERRMNEGITVRVDVVGRWMGEIVLCFSSLIKRGRIRLGNYSDQLSFLFPQWQQF